MNSEDLYNAITELPDAQVLEGERKLRRTGIRWVPCLSLAAVLAIVILGAVRFARRPSADPSQASSTDAVASSAAKPTDAGPPAELLSYTLAGAEYPKMAPYAFHSDYIEDGTGRLNQSAYRDALQKWMDSRMAMRSDADYTEGLDEYLRNAVPVLLSGAGTENRVVSPMNVYMALAMLSETTAGESRQELLTLLHAPDIQTLRARANALWRANYSDDGRLTALLAASVWLRDDLKYDRQTVETLASNYYGSVFSGEMGSQAYNQALQAWMNQQTKGLLSDQIQDLKTSADTVLALITTVYFKAAWEGEFHKSVNLIFHAPTGEQDCDFMLESTLQDYYEGDGFAAAGKRLSGGSSMYFLLPEEGMDPEALLENESVLDFLNGTVGRDATPHEQALVTLAIPEFDVSSQLDLIDKLNILGVTAVFDKYRADFSPLVANDENLISVDEAKHGARILVDKKGVTGAAYTEIEPTYAGVPEDPLREVELMLDRPFLFVVTNEDGLPLFIGVVNSPKP